MWNDLYLKILDNTYSNNNNKSAYYISTTVSGPGPTKFALTT